MFCTTGSCNTNQSAQDDVTMEWDSYAGEWDDLAAGYADGCYKLLVETIGTDRLLFDQKPVIVDFGCGTGLLTSKLQQYASKIIAIDAAPSMIRILKEKIRDQEWTNVEAYTGVVAQIDNNQAIQNLIQQYEGTVDIVIASSVLSFIPDEDLHTTMRIIGRLLKPGTGIFFHTDWPNCNTSVDDGPVGKITNELATQLYNVAGLVEETTKICTINTRNRERVFVGVATKP